MIGPGPAGSAIVESPAFSCAPPLHPFPLPYAFASLCNSPRVLISISSCRFSEKHAAASEAYGACTHPLVATRLTLFSTLFCSLCCISFTAHHIQNSVFRPDLKALLIIFFLSPCHPHDYPQKTCNREGVVRELDMAATNLDA